MPNRFESPFTHFLRHRRQQLGLTQEELGLILGVTGDFIGLVETGRRRLDLDRIPALAEALDVEIIGTCLTVLYERAPHLYDALFPHAGELISH
jgi:transcriptional regulator with XRE-family HTH domain